MTPTPRRLAESEIEVVREVLRPFAEASRVETERRAESDLRQLADNEVAICVGSRTEYREVTWGDLRRAAALLSDLGEREAEGVEWTQDVVAEAGWYWVRNTVAGFTEPRKLPNRCFIFNTHYRSRYPITPPPPPANRTQGAGRGGTKPARDDDEHVPSN
jgi:hypothetical protein